MWNRRTTRTIFVGLAPIVFFVAGCERDSAGQGTLAEFERKAQRYAASEPHVTHDCGTATRENAGVVVDCVKSFHAQSLPAFAFIDNLDTVSAVVVDDVRRLILGDIILLDVENGVRVDRGSYEFYECQSPTFLDGVSGTRSVPIDCESRLLYPDF